MSFRGLFKKEKQEHRVMREALKRSGQLVPEYHRPTPECRHPERWNMHDSMTAEVEVLEFLYTLVKTAKPSLAVETGTFLGISTLAIAEAMEWNGLGRVVSCEIDPQVFEATKQKIAASEFRDRIELRNESSLEVTVAGEIDLLFSDSDLDVREEEVRRYLPQISPYGLILMHDSSSHLKQVREAALRLEREGLISIVLLPTPRGLVIGQKLDGRR